MIVATYLWGENMKNSARLFSPTVYADGQLFNSLGAVLIASMLIVLCVSCSFVTRDDIFRRILKSRHVKGTLWTYTTCVSFLVQSHLAKQ